MITAMARCNKNATRHCDRKIEFRTYIIRPATELSAAVQIPEWAVKACGRLGAQASKRAPGAVAGSSGVQGGRGKHKR